MTLESIARMFRSRPSRVVAPDEGYTLWAECYPPWAHNPLMAAEQSVVEAIIRAARPRRALDVGTGTGRCLTTLAEARARVAVGVDRSMAMLRQTAPDTRCICGDACRLPFADGCFDLVCSSLMAGDIERLDRWVAEASRVLARGGTLVYSDFHPAWMEHGWKRTFRAASGELVELRFHPHTIEQHLALLDDASLTVRAIREPRVASLAAPAVVVFHACKPW